MTADEASVFVPGLGFRPGRGGLRLPEPVTITKDDDRAFRVTVLTSTEKGTELTFELRDRKLEAECSVSVTDPRWTNGVEVRLRDSNGAAVPASGRGQRLSFGGQRFGAFRRELLFDQLPPDTQRVSVELRGELGEWDAPLDLLPMSDSGAIPVHQVGAENEQDGITVRIRGVATTGTAIYLDVEATAGHPVKSIVGIGGWMVRNGNERLALIDEHGRRLEEIHDDELPRAAPDGSGRTIAAFPAVPQDAGDLTLVVPAVLVQESSADLEIALPIYAPTDAMFGRYPVTIRWADVVKDSRQGPGAPPTRAVEVHLRLGSSSANRRVLRPSLVNVDGLRNWNYGIGYANPEGPILSVGLADGASAKTVTLVDPVVEVRGPWEVKWRR